MICFSLCFVSDRLYTCVDPRSNSLAKKLKTRKATHDEIKDFLKTTFPLAMEKFHFFEKANVNGPSARPVYDMVRMDIPAEEGGQVDIKWNYDILIVDHLGKPRKRIESSREPYAKLKPYLERLFAEQAKEQPK
jgi:glutathione peroxidase-family protein